MISRTSAHCTYFSFDFRINIQNTRASSRARDNRVKLFFFLFFFCCAFWCSSTRSCSSRHVPGTAIDLFSELVTDYIWIVRESRRSTWLTVQFQRNVSTAIRIITILHGIMAHRKISSRMYWNKSEADYSQSALSSPWHLCKIQQWHNVDVEPTPIEWMTYNSYCMLCEFDCLHLCQQHSISIVVLFQQSHNDSRA